MMFKIKSKREDRRMGEYPCIDHVNTAMLYLLHDPPLVNIALEELYWAVTKSGGRFYDDVKAKYQKLAAQGKVR